MNTKEKLIEIFTELLELPAGMDAQSVRRVGYRRWDSLAHASLIMAIESEFSITLDVKDYDRITSFESTLLLIEERRS